MKNHLKRFNALIIIAVMLVVSVGTTLNADAASMRLNKKKVTLTVGKSVTLKVKGTKKIVKWVSSNKKIVTVTKKGKVTARKKGAAIVTAKVGKKKLKCRVTVKAKAAPAPAVTPLTEYWSADSQAAASLREYVTKVTNEKDAANFIPKKDRIAVFDMDGTLTCETYYTYYDTMMFIQYCLKDHPDDVAPELIAEAKSINPDYKATEQTARYFAQAYAGMTIDELYNYAVEFGQGYTSSFNNMRYIDGFYLPMVELVKYLYENDFTIYVVSGTERTTTRAIIANSPVADFVTPNHVIGTEFEVKQKGHEEESSNMNYKYADGDDLVITGGFVQKNLNSNKVIYIEREIGKRPVLAFGNSGSDTSMMNYAIDSRNKYPAQAYMIVNDDNEREWGKQVWETESAKNIGMNYVPVSMKTDFGKIYPDGITPSEKQYDPADWTPAEAPEPADSGDASEPLDNAA
ncbi:MAG: hypothetical protein E7220_04830 [Clostridiales bacterium]|nr:hypothetical protein [Clostridiales bacterium]